MSCDMECRRIRPQVIPSNGVQRCRLFNQFASSIGRDVSKAFFARLKPRPGYNNSL